MITLLFSTRTRRFSPADWWASLVSVAVTVALLFALLASLVRRTSAPLAARSDTVGEERITFVAAAPRPRPDIPRTRIRALQPAPAIDLPAVVVALPLATREQPATDTDTGTTHGTAPVPPVSTSTSISISTSDDRLTRLVPGAIRRGHGAWGPVIVFDPFAVRALPSHVVRDSLLGVLRDTVRLLARSRVATGAERDAIVKERMLARELTGRVLLDPPAPGTGTYSGRGGGFVLPLFSPGISRAVRVRDSIAFAENLPRLERLRQRADSLRRLRGDIP